MVHEVRAHVLQQISQESEPLRRGLERCSARCDERAAAGEEFQRSCNRQFAEQGQALHDLAARTLAETRLLGERVAEECAAVREELASLAVSSFQGEVKLWKQLTLQTHGTPGPALTS